MFNVVYIRYRTHMQSLVAYHLACSLAILYTRCRSVTCVLQCFPPCPRAGFQVVLQALRLVAGKLFRS
jgi:hypothetical protein